MQSWASDEHQKRHGGAVNRKRAPDKNQREGENTQRFSFSQFLWRSDEKCNLSIIRGQFWSETYLSARRAFVTWLGSFIEI